MVSGRNLNNTKSMSDRSMMKVVEVWFCSSPTNSFAEVAISVVVT